MGICYFCDTDVGDADAHILGCWHKLCWREYTKRLRKHRCFICNVEFNKTEMQDENYTKHELCDMSGTWSGYNK